MTSYFYTYFIFAQSSSSSNPLSSVIVPIVLMIAMFYLLLIRPQQKQRKEQEARIKSLEKGDLVITTGGFHGSVHQISEKTVTLKGGGDNVFLTFEKSSIATVNKLKSHKGSSSEDKTSEKSASK